MLNFGGAGVVWSMRATTAVDAAVTDITEVKGGAAGQMVSQIFSSSHSSSLLFFTVSYCTRFGL